jgi:hypothetical protein
MRIRWKQLLLAATFTCALTTAVAQTAIVDAALLAKANGGDAAAQVLVGESYAGGGGQARSSRQLTGDCKQAAEWYGKAAAQGNVDGQLHLAALYRDGRGVVRDMAQAAGWYRKAAEQGNVLAQATLGLLYSMGQGVPHSDVEAYFWLDLAAAVKGPDREKYAANRQMIGTHITTDELDEVQERVAKWIAAHPR